MIYTRGIVGSVRWVEETGLWLVACGLWLVACGLWLVACGLWLVAVPYTHLRAHEMLRYLVCRLLLEKKKYVLAFLVSTGVR